MRGQSLRMERVPHLRIEMWGIQVFMLVSIMLWWSLAAVGQAGKPQPGAAPALQQADAAFRAGYAAMQAGKPEEARRDFAEAVRLAPKLPEARVALGVILAQLGHPEEAIPEFEMALKLKPGDAVALGNLSAAHEGLGRKLAGQGKLNEAEGQLRPAVTSLEAMEGTPEIVARKAELQDELGSVLAQRKQWAEAEAAFREALRLNPEIGAGPHMHLGVVLVEEKQIQPGLVELGKAVQLAPKNAVAQFQLGRGLAAAGDDEQAVPHLEEALKLSPKLPGGALELAMAEQRLGRQEESIPLFHRAIELEPRNATALTNLGLALTQAGKAAEAVPFLQRALVETPNGPVVHEDLGVAELQQSHFDEAIAQFEKARELDAENPQLHYDLGLAYKLKDRMDDAVRELVKAASLGPTLPDPPYTLGILYMQMGRQEAAAAQLRASLALRPANGDGWAVLGSVLKQLDRREEAEAALRKAVELLPNQPGAHITLAAVLAEEGKTQEAAAERKLAAGLSRTAVNRQRAQLSTNAGNQSLQRGEIAEAVGRYLEAIAADPGYAEAHSQLAVAYERQGRAEDAKAERAKAIQTGKSAQP
jgi:protein O-GlcNAc transferase